MRLLGEQPLVLEQIAIGLDHVGVWPDDLGQPARCWAKDLAQPALSGVAIQRAALGPFEPGAIFAQVVEKETSLVLEGRNARQSLELSGVEAPGGYRQLQP